MPFSFISHSSKDRVFVESELMPLLKRHGVACWYSPLDIKTATDWEASIRQALNECDRFIVLLSPHSVSSEWVQAEVHWALENRKDRVIPVLLADCEPGNLHLKLLRIQHIDCRSNLASGLRKLVNTFGVTWIDQAADETVPEARSKLSFATRPSEMSGTIMHDLAKHGKYAIVHILAHTGFGLVLLARQTDLKSKVAIKAHLLPALSASELSDLVTRIKERSRLVHPSIVSMQEVFSAGSCLYVVMEYVENAVNVWEFARRVSIPVDKAVKLFTEILTGLSYAHRFGIVHGEINPYNVLVASDEHSYLTGFDRMPVYHAYSKHMLQGTMRYVAPEQLRGIGDSATPQTDVWLSGVLLYEMITGEAPFFNQNEILAHAGWSVFGDTKALTFPNSIDGALKAICEKCLRPKPDDRYLNASELLQAVRAIKPKKSWLWPFAR